MDQCLWLSSCRCILVCWFIFHCGPENFICCEVNTKPTLDHFKALKFDINLVPLAGLAAHTTCKEAPVARLVQEFTSRILWATSINLLHGQR